MLGQGPVKLVDKGGLSGFGLGDAFQANAAASAKLKPDFHWSSPEKVDAASAADCWLV